MATVTPSTETKVRYIIQERQRGDDALGNPRLWSFSNDATDNYLGLGIDQARAWKKSIEDDLLDIEARIVMETTVVIKTEVV